MPITLVRIFPIKLAIIRLFVRAVRQLSAKACRVVYHLSHENAILLRFSGGNRTRSEEIGSHEEHRGDTGDE